jgi:hypothetical protein
MIQSLKFSHCSLCFGSSCLPYPAPSPLWWSTGWHDQVCQWSRCEMLGHCLCIHADQVTECICSSEDRAQWSAPCELPGMEGTVGTHGLVSKWDMLYNGKGVPTLFLLQDDNTCDQLLTLCVLPAQTCHPHMPPGSGSTSQALCFNHRNHRNHRKWHAVLHSLARSCLHT